MGRIPGYFTQSLFLPALTVLLLLHCPATNAGAATIRVPAHQPTIQAGIDAAADGDTVLVADGTWTGAGNRDLDFGGKAITVRSQYGPTNCIIDGEQEGRGFHLHSGEGRTSAIRGFTITNCGIYNDVTYHWSDGSGIFCEGASPVIEGNLILDNRGNGIHCRDGADPLIIGNTIAGNGPNTGAGIKCSGSSPVISNNLIHSNEVSIVGPNSGGGISCHDSEAVIAGNEITGNTAVRYAEFYGRGGGISVWSFTGRIEDNLIRNNEAGGMGGGIFIVQSSPLVLNNLILGNRAENWGGGISIEYKSESDLVGNTISGNSVESPSGSGGGLHVTTSIHDPEPLGDPEIYRVTAYNSIITGNTAPTGSQITVHSPTSYDIAELVLSHCDVEGGEDEVAVENDARLVWGTGMIDADPLFATGPEGDHYLSQIAAGQGVDSPCVDSGGPTLPQPWGTTRTDNGRDEPGADMGYHYPTFQRLVTGPGPGYDNPPEVRLFFPRQNAAPTVSFNAYAPLRYGVNVTCGDVTGDGFDEIITGAGPGWLYGAHVRGFDGTGRQLPGLSYLAYPIRHWGVNVACGELDGFGADEIVTGPGPGPNFSSHVRIWQYNAITGSVTGWGWGSFFAYGTQRWGVNVACGDLDGDGYDEIVTGAGPGPVFGPHVRGWNSDSGPVSPMPGVSFMAYGTLRYGVRVSCGDLDGDGIDEIVTAPGPSPVFGSHIRGWNVDGGTVSPMPGASFMAWPPGEAGYGAYVYAGADLDGDGHDDLVVGGGPDPRGGCPVRVFNFATGSPDFWLSLEAYPGLGTGNTVAGGVFHPEITP